MVIALMFSFTRFARPLRLLACLSCLSFTGLAQQPAATPNRIADHAELASTVRLSGTLPAWVNPSRDAGPAPVDSAVALTFVLARAPRQQAAFEQLLADQQNPASPNYHHWLTPQQIGDQFGPTQHDVDAIVVWLRSVGLQVKPVAPSRLFLDAYGPAQSAAAALGTSFRLFQSLGKTHLSATTEPSIPVAFSSVIGSISGLTEVDLLPQSHVEAPAQTGRGGASPQYTSANGNVHYLFPKDFATIFDINPLYNAGINGAGQKIAVIGRSQVNLSDISAFQSVAALPANAPNIIVVPTGTNPGTVTDDEGESDLDLERVLGVAPGVTADFVISGSSSMYNGIYVAAQYEVQTLMDPVLSLSYGACERNAGASGVALWSNLFSQAAAEGISVFVSSADSGAATCDTQFATPPAVQYLSINYICANPYTTCVGGTEFADTASPSTYWASTNSTGGSSALRYIPEGGWNDPSSTNATTGVTSYYARGSGGGVSTIVTKPAYQTGTGVPSDGFRDVPDVSFPASSHDGYFGCEADITAFNGNCATGGGVIFSGTSAAAPGWAGVTALLNQKAGVRQGNLNPLIYRLAASPANGAFHDVTPATTGLASCDVTVPSLCNNSLPSPTSLSGGLVGYPVTVGYDQVTGWGSADVNAFVAAAIVPYQVTTTAVSVSPASINTTQTTVLTATVANSVAGTPTGNVQFYLNGAATGSPVALANGTTATLTLGPIASAGTYAVTAIYSGNTVFVGSTSAAVSLVVINVAPTLSVSSSPASLSFAAGSSAGSTSTLTYTSGNGLAGTVTATCSIAYSAGTPAVAPTCSASGATLTANGTATGTLTISTIAPHAGLSPFAQNRPAQIPTGHSPGLTTTLGTGFASLAALFLLVSPRRRRAALPRLLALLCCAATLSALTGCGGGSTTSRQLSGGTTTGTYTVTVTATSGNTSATTTVALTVQ